MKEWFNWILGVILAIIFYPLIKKWGDDFVKNPTPPDVLDTCHKKQGDKQDGGAS